MRWLSCSLALLLPAIAGAQVSVVTGEETMGEDTGQQQQQKEEPPPSPEVHALRQQLKQQQQQVQLLQQQVAGQNQQLQSLDQVNQNLTGVQQGIAASQQQVAQRDADRNQTLQRLDVGLSALTEADQQLAVASNNVNFEELAELMPGQAREYVLMAQAWLNSGDYTSARSYLTYAYQVATQAREQGTALVPGQ